MGNQMTLDAGKRLPQIFQLMVAGQFDSAEFQLGHLLLSAPHSVPVLTALGEVHYLRRNLRQASNYITRALACLLPGAGLDEVLYLSKMLRCIGDSERAIEVVRQIQSPASLPSASRAKLAVHWLNLDAVDESVAMFATVPDDAKSDFQMTMSAIALLYSGNVDAARNQLEKALQRNPANAGAAHQLSMLRVDEGRPERVASLREHLAQATTPADRAMMHFALFNELDAEGELAQAFSALQEANRARTVHDPHDAPNEERLLDRYLSALDSLEFNADSGFPSTMRQSPVFIIGLPRSGTTLLEKMLSGLGDVHDVGEHLGFRKSLEQQFGTLFGNPFEVADQPLALIDFMRLGAEYRSKSEWLSAGHRYYTDKEPFNYVFCGLIAQALPDARILHVRRNPMDSCFSMYKQNFAHGSFAASYTLDDVCAHYRNYERLMAYWRRRLGGRIMEVRYEEMVSHPNRMLAQIAEYAQFEAVSESRQETKVVRASTLSAAQIQKPIHAGNINAWAKYAEFLQPLREQLNDEYVSYMSAIEGVEIL